MFGDIFDLGWKFLENYKTWVILGSLLLLIFKKIRGWVWSFALWVSKPLRNQAEIMELKEGFDQQKRETKEMEERLMSRIDSILMELQPNGGKSFRDVFEAMDKNVKRIDDRQQYQEERYRISQDHEERDMPRWEFDKDGRLKWCNLHFVRLFDRSFDHFKGDDWYQTVTPSLRDDVRKEFRLVVKDRSSFERKIVFVKGNGSRFEALVRVAPVLSSDGQRLLGMVGSLLHLRDVPPEDFSDG